MNAVCFLDDNVFEQIIMRNTKKEFRRLHGIGKKKFKNIQTETFWQIPTFADKFSRRFLQKCTQFTKVSMPRNYVSTVLQSLLKYIYI